MPENISEVKMFYGNVPIKEITDGIEPGIKRVRMETETLDLPEWEVNACFTSWPTDASEVRNLRCIFVVDELYKVFQRLNVRVTANEMQYIVQKLLTKMEGIRKQAMNNAFGVADENDIRLQILEEYARKR